MLTLLLLLSCKSPVEVSSPDDTANPEKPYLDIAPAFDPILGNLDLQGADLTEIYDGDNLIAEVADQWDGKASGVFVASGEYQLVHHIGDFTLENTVNVVRCGVVNAYAEGDDQTATAIPLYWHVSHTTQDLSLPFASLDAMENGEEQAQFDDVSNELELAPENGTLPLAFTYSSRPIITLELGESTILGTSGLELTEVFASIDGWTILSGEKLTPGTPLVIQADEPLSETLGVLDYNLAINYFVKGEQQDYVIGTQSVPLRFYLMLDKPSFNLTGELYSPWLAAIDPALRAIDGVEAAEGPVLDALVEWLFYDSGLKYDTKYGAAAYCWYQGSNWIKSTLNFSSFLKRGAGNTVNCSDCASILVAYSNMLGNYLDYTIILENYNLNYILAIGGEDFTHCPFGSHGCSFSYHAVTTNDAGSTIWDFTLVLDGDENPSSLPSETLLVQSISGEEYLERLVMSGRAEYKYQAQVNLQ